MLRAHEAQNCYRTVQYYGSGADPTRRTEAHEARTTLLAHAARSALAEVRGRVITTLALFCQFYVAVRLTPRRTSWRQLYNPVPYPPNEREGSAPDGPTEVMQQPPCSDCHFVATRTPQKLPPQLEQPRPRLLTAITVLPRTRLLPFQRDRTIFEFCPRLSSRKQRNQPWPQYASRCTRPSSSHAPKPSASRQSPARFGAAPGSRPHACPSRARLTKKLTSTLTCS